MFVRRAPSPLAARRPGVLARRARAPGDDRRGGAASRCVRWCAATAAATAATSCTSGSPCCSSASPRPRPSSTRATCALARADHAVDGYDVHYVRRDGGLRPREDHARGGPRRCCQGRPPRRDAAADAQLLPVGRAVRVRARRALLRGRGDQRGGSEGRPARTSGSRCSPTSTAQDDRRRAGPAAEERAARAAGPARRSASPSATRRSRRRRRSALIVSPLVTWIWIGGLIVIAGALIALWPSP